MTANHLVSTRRSRPRSRSLLQVGLGSLLAAAACSNLLGIESENTPVACISNADCATNFVCETNRCVCAVNCGGGGESGDTGVGGGAGVVAGGPAGAMSGSAGRAPVSHGGDAGESNGGEAGATQPSGGKAGTSQGGAGGMTFVPGGAGAGEGGESGATSTCDPEHPECPLVCGDRKLSNACPTCTPEQACKVPPSCVGEVKKCTEGSVSCCLSYAVPGGEFLRGCDATCRASCVTSETPDFPAKVAPFSLDVFEVTVGRFRRFVDEYPSSKPTTPQGDGTPSERSWNQAWDDMLPSTQQDLIDQLNSRDFCPGAATWSDDITANDDRPMNCVTWFEAAAFCIWDGGRLPTEAEWNFAAAAGDEQRIFPWSSPPEDATIDDDYAVYTSDFDNPRTSPEPVGGHPLGRGRWGQYDLGGNVVEWVWDAAFDCYADVPCDNCGSAAGTEDRAARGGSFKFSSVKLMSDARDRHAAGTAYEHFGFRCAR